MRVKCDPNEVYFTNSLQYKNAYRAFLKIDDSGDVGNKGLRREEQNKFNKKSRD